MKSWFLAPDFTFTPDGPLQLGAVIPHPSRPNRPLHHPAFTVTKEKGVGHNTSLSGSGPAGPVPIEVGAGISGGKESSKTDSYETAPGIIFAYRLHAIRVRGSGTASSEMFSNKKTFMHGRPVPDPEPFEVVDVDAEVLKADRKEEEDAPNYEMEDLGDEEYCFLAQA
ncbi:hypothetical protein J7337_012194 [Fusarium musae]|uniref:Uncharacterized protein n=1 Tax=Fusarium musae TaxID=1042133 RepID=A0A9P8D5E5_9HYPO|nr:hypothetical protein J7337_012194 [Fusarium musae]KAG9495640.1 hypothetical protein J7337_012194 [Fusarium musae]